MSESIADFLLARIAEDEASVSDSAGWYEHRWRPARERMLAECKAKRAIVEFHKSWPTLVETPPQMEPVDPDNPSSYTFRMSRQIAWLTEREYVKQFGTEPPTSQIMRALVSVYADHPDFDPAWKLEPTEAELAEMTVEQLNAYSDTFDE